MISRECKRLAEIDFLVTEVSRHSARERSIRRREQTVKEGPTKFAGREEITMSWFQDYLREHGEKLDERFRAYENDESWFVFGLFLLRQGFRDAMGEAMFEAALESCRREGVHDPLAAMSPESELRKPIEFVSLFMCFFVPKPPRYAEEIAAFKGYFIPGFQSKRDRQVQLFHLAKPSFAETPLEEARQAWRWDSVEHFFKPQQASASVRAD